MANLGGIGPDTVKAQQHKQRGETWIVRPGYFRMCRHICSQVPSVLPLTSAGRSMLIACYSIVLNLFFGIKGGRWRHNVQNLLAIGTDNSPLGGISLQRVCASGTKVSTRMIRICSKNGQ